MQPVTYFFASLSPFLGLLIGIILIKIAPEERKPLEKYFVLLKKILLLLAFAFLIFYYFGKWNYLIALAALSAFMLLAGYKIKNPSKKSIITYAILGILFYLSSNNANLFVIESSIVLLYGIATSSLEFSKKKPYKTFFYGAGFAAASNLLFLTISHF